MIRAALPVVLISSFVFAAPTNPDQAFFDEAAGGGIAQVELGKLATEKGEDSTVKQFGKLMAKDNEKINAEFAALATRKKIDANSGYPMKLQATAQELQAQSGPDFDKKYLAAMLTAQKDRYAAFKKESKSGKDEDFKAFATGAPKKLKHHLDMIEIINKDMKAKK